jgi:hypothetical protein
MTDSDEQWRAPRRGPLPVGLSSSRSEGRPVRARRCHAPSLCAALRSLLDVPPRLQARGAPWRPHRRCAVGRWCCRGEGRPAGWRRWEYGVHHPCVPRGKTATREREGEGCGRQATARIRDKGGAVAVVSVAGILGYILMGLYYKQVTGVLTGEVCCSLATRG